MLTVFAAPLSPSNIWQRSHIVLDPGSWEVKACFGDTILVTAPTQGTIQFGIPTNVMAFVSVWTDLVTRAQKQGWQPTWLDRLYGPNLTIITSATATEVHRQVWRQFAASAQMQPLFVSVVDIQTKFFLNLKQKQQAILSLHIGHQKTEVILVSKAELVAQTTFRWELDRLAHATQDRRRWQTGRWRWELAQWLSLQKCTTDILDVLVMSGGGSYVDELSELIASFSTRTVIWVQKPELFLIEKNSQVVSVKS